MGDEPTVVLVVPITPAATGNGLAMRAGMFVETLSSIAAVHVVVVPVSGAGGDVEWVSAQARSVTVVDLPTGARAREHMTRQLADEELRDRLSRTAPLPIRAALAPATLADDLVISDAATPAALLGMRLYLAPFATRLARRLGARRLVIDADDDDGALLRALGDTDEADAFDRLARCWLPDADAVTAASPVDASGVATRSGLAHVDVVPNTVAIPGEPPPPPGQDRLLFLGNLTYEPNRAAARELVNDILPLVRARHPNATVDLVGPHDGSLADLADTPGVRLSGMVPDVAPAYERADVVVVPLRHGSGTRIKVLEAFAHERSVVSTRVGTSGLSIDHDEAVIVDDSREMADAVVALLDDPTAARRMTGRARQLVQSHYSLTAVAPLVHAAVLGR